MNKVRQLTFRDLRPNVAEVQKQIQESRHPVSLLLDGVNDPRNIGGMFRLADAALVEHIYFFRQEEDSIHAKSKRISRHTTDLVPHSFLRDLSDVRSLAANAELVALEYTNESLEYTEFVPAERTILIIGNEQKGVSEDLLDLATRSLHLPMFGLKTSMNVMCATAVATYELVRKVREKRV